MSYFIPDPRFEDANLLVPGRKPIAPVELDRSNPLTRNMVGCYLMNKDHIFNIANGKVTAMASDDGVLDVNRTKFQALDGTFIDLYSDDLFPQGTCMVSFFHETGSSPWSLFFEAGQDGVGLRLGAYANNNRVLMEVNNLNWNSDAHGDFRGQDRILFGSWDTDNNSRVINSEFYDASNGGAITAPSTNYQIKLGARVTYDDLPVDYMNYIFFWNRLLSPPEKMALKKSPYQFLVPA